MLFKTYVMGVNDGHMESVGKGIRMIGTLLRRINQFYQGILIILMLVTMASIGYFWKLGFLDGSRGTELYHANYVVERVIDKGVANQIKNLALEENSKVALKNLNELEEELDKINDIAGNDIYQEVKKKTGQVKTAMNNLISFPRSEQVVEIFGDKVEKFHFFVTENRWKTLTRMSERVLGQVKGHLDLTRLDRFTKTIEREFESITSITDNSVLNRSDKAEILSRVSNMRVEINMLNKYNEERSFFINIMDDYEKTLVEWIQAISPELSLQKMKQERTGRYYILGMLIVLVLASLAFFTSFFFNRTQHMRVQQQLETFLKRFVTDNLMQEERAGLEEFSKDFQSFALQTSSYIDKRMSFGAIFQETLPIGAVLLDQNIKVIWANKIFCDTWPVSESDIKKEYLSWDYLQKLTNLGESDPVLDALQKNIAGIYQIQVKLDQEEGTTPYEMFVSPTTYNRKTRVMLFFYPLSSVQEAITDQARSIVNPINRTLDILLQDGFEMDLKGTTLMKDYEIAGVISIYDKFVELQRKAQQAMNDYQTSIEKYSIQIDNLGHINDESRDIGREGHKAVRDQISYLIQVKESVIDLSSLGKEYEEVNRELEEILESAIINLKKIYANNSELVTIMDSFTQGMPKIDGAKNDLKNLKANAHEARMRLSHGLSQFVHFKKKITDPVLSDRFNKAFERASAELRYLDEVSGELDRKIVSMEVMMSKLQLLLSGLEDKVARHIQLNDKTSVLEVIDQHKSLSAVIKKSTGQLTSTENRVVGELQKLFVATKLNLNCAKRLEQTLGEHELSYRQEELNHQAGDASHLN